MTGTIDFGDSRPLLESASGATLTLTDGTLLLDLSSHGLGYGHPHILDRVESQMRSLSLSSRVQYGRPLVELCDRLSTILPSPLDVSYFTNSDAEAIDGALKLAKGVHPQRRKIVAMRDAYHGHLSSTLAVSDDSVSSAFSELPLQTERVLINDLDGLRQALTNEVACVVIAPIVCDSTSASVQQATDEFLQLARKLCDGSGALLIYDETITGLGPTGRWLASSASNTVPDAVVLGGLLGGGALPIAAYVTSRALNDRVYKGKDPVLHGTTTGGNPAACTAALACLDVIAAENLLPRAVEIEEQLDKALSSWCHRYSMILDHQGCGTLHALKFCQVGDAYEVATRARDRGVLLRYDTRWDQTVLGFRPPLLISNTELQSALKIVDGLIQEHSTEKLKGHATVAGGS